MWLVRVRDSSGNPLWNEAKQRLQRIARPSLSRDCLVPRNVLNEGTPKKILDLLQKKRCTKT